MKVSIYISKFLFVLAMFASCQKDAVQVPDFYACALVFEDSSAQHPQHENLPAIVE